MKFRKKSVVIEAEQWKKGKFIDGVFTKKDVDKDYPKVIKFANYLPADLWEMVKSGDFGLIHTLEGWHIVSENDWVITGVEGEKYPCKPDIFEKTYEKV